MPRSQISIKLDEDTLRRVDEAVEILGETRTAYIERAVLYALDNLDSMIEEMERESPLTAAILDNITGNKKLLRTVARLLASEMPPEKVDDRSDELKKIRAEADRRKAAKKKGDPDG